MDSKEMKLSIDVYYWIQEKYKFYDKLEGRHCGEKYTRRVFKDASDYFSFTVEKIKDLYDKFPKARKEALDFKSKFEQVSKGVAVTKFNNKKVKIKVDEILKDKKRNNSKFIDFIQNNREIIFTAITSTDMKTMYEFKEDNTWVFFEDDLEEVKED